MRLWGYHRFKFLLLEMTKCRKKRVRIKQAGEYKPNYKLHQDQGWLWGLGTCHSPACADSLPVFFSRLQSALMVLPITGFWGQHIPNIPLPFSFCIPLYYILMKIETGLMVETSHLNFQTDYFYIEKWSPKLCWFILIVSFPSRGK